MKIKVGTFNLNNLFSRFNFAANIAKMKDHDAALTVRYEFTDETQFRIRKYKGKLVKGKDAKDRAKVAARVLDMDLDVLAVQEVENIDILKEFNREDLSGLYPHIILIEGNDKRLIDVAVMSKLPLGAVTSHQRATHPTSPNSLLFGRDLLQIDVWNQSRTVRLFTLFNNHLKSNYVPWNDDGNGQAKNIARRIKQTEGIQNIVTTEMRSDSRFIITGDMNDTPDAVSLSAMLTIDGNSLFDGLQNPTEIGEMSTEKPGEEPTSTAWTHRYRKGAPPEHHLYDQIWLSQALVPAYKGGFIARRKNKTGDGSDHDPAWVELDF